ncbi:MAG: primosomal protein N' [bacterium]
MDNESKEIVQVVVNVPIDKVLDYSVPPELRKDIDTGKRVLVPFGTRKIIGCVISHSAPTTQKNLKSIAKVLDEVPLATEELISLSEWISHYYICARGEALNAILPFKARTPSSGGISGSGKLPVKSPARDLNNNQTLCLDKIKESLDASSHRVFLLHGLEESQKTQIIIESVRHTLDKKRQVILLAPEVSLAEDLAERVGEKIGRENIAVFHSHMSEKERYGQWLRVRKAKVSVAIGTRSAVFSPFDNLGLIVITDEHDTSYKQEQKPMYNAREVAIERAKHFNATVVFSSSYPSVDSYHKAKENEYELLEVQAPDDIKKPSRIRTVDIKEEVQKRNRGVLSAMLREATRQRLERKEQAVFFLNRRGYANFTVCRKCGFVIKCPKCDIALSYHIDAHELRCHHCTYSKQPHGRENRCPECGSPLMNFIGRGTQKAEGELKKLFPGIRIIRVDLDTLKNNSLDELLSRFNNGGADVLLGTQAILRSPALPGVSLIGILSADTMLNVPDFHSAEYTYSLCSQLVDLCHRSKLDTDVIIQTYNPTHYAIDAVKKQDYKLFYENEISLREELLYPPFSRIANIVLKGKKEEKVTQASEKLGAELEACAKKEGSDTLILGPSPAPLLRLRGTYRWQILIKAKNTQILHKLIKSTMENKKSAMTGVKVSVDVDPVSIA